MDKKQANKIVKDTFENPFNKEQFKYLVKNLLNHIEETPETIYRGNYIPDAYAPYVNTLERIGKYLDSDERSIDVLIVNLKKYTSLERARTMQRNFIAWYLNGSRGGVLKDAALVAFVSPGQEDWRFSLVKMDYRFENKKDGNVKVKEEFTPARRWSFLVGLNEKSHTAQSRLVKILTNDVESPSLAQLEDAFNIETVSKEFFWQYRELFIRTKEELDKIIRADKKVKLDFQNNGINSVDFAKKLLGQIVFLYFLQKKGWFGVERDKKWGTGSKRFLRELFEKKHGKYNNFFNDILEPLFYDALSRDRSDIDHWNDHFKCKIPFLNGGLFDPINDYDWVRTDIVFPNDLFSNNYKTKQGDKGTGILDIFDRYNFTVKEDEPLEKEVAIDPELLGKAYEKFNAIRIDNYIEYKETLERGKPGAENKFNKQYGVYYTPREIVHYMCQQSLSNYLVEELKEKVTKEEIDILIKHGENIIEHDSRVKGSEKETKTYPFKMPEKVRENSLLIDEKLSVIRVCDPAVGSGAFLVGMMNEIARARNALTTYLGGKQQRTFYDFKRNAIHYSLYGVDIDSGATEIAKLRLWLSLIVDEEDILQIKPLPNLDYKIMQGNSLIEDLIIGDSVIKFNIDDLVKVDHRTRKTKNFFTKEVQQMWFKDKSEDIFEELKELHSVYFEENNKNKRLILKRKIDNAEHLFISARCAEEIDKLKVLKRNSHDAKKIEKIEKQIKTVDSTIQELTKKGAKPFFLWKLKFSEIFSEKGGFDVVIANPPYGANIDSSVNIYATLYPNTTKSFKDIYKIFIEMGLLKLVKPQKGLLSYIVPNTLLLQPRYVDARKFLLDFSILEILNLGEGVFEDVVVPTCVIFVHSKLAKNNVIRFADLSSKSKFNSNMDSIQYIANSQAEYLNSPGLVFVEKCRKIKNDEIAFDEIVNMKDAGINYQRIKVGLSEKGNSNLSKRLLYEGDKLTSTDQEYWKGSDINSYYISKETGRYVKTRIRLKDNERVILNKEYFAITPKLLWRQTAAYPIAVIDERGVWFGRSIQAGIIKSNRENDFDYKYLLALLNSKYIRYLYIERVKESGRVFPQVKLEKMKSLPIKAIDFMNQRPYVEIVDRILLITQSEDFSVNALKQAEVNNYMQKLDRMIYKLYELTPEEIKMVEDSFN